MSYQPAPRPKAGAGYGNPFYQSAPWRNLRNWFILHYPLCHICNQQGTARAGTQVDHIKPINSSDAYDTQGGKYGEPLDPANLQTLCTMHHAQKSARERHGK